MAAARKMRRTQLSQMCALDEQTVDEFAQTVDEFTHLLCHVDLRLDRLQQPVLLDTAFSGFLYSQELLHPRRVAVPFSPTHICI